MSYTKDAAVKSVGALLAVGIIYSQGPHCTGKTRKKKRPKKIPVRENTGNLEMLPEHRENTGNFVDPVF